MKEILLIAFAIFLLMACTPDAKPEIRRIMNQQVVDWNNGDIESFMAAYWNNDSLLFIGKSGLTYGWKTVLNNYKKNYPNPGEMGMLKFELDQIKSIDRSHYFVVGKWKLQREKDEPAGYFSLVWKKIGGEWKIISDHSS